MMISPHQLENGETTRQKKKQNGFMCKMQYGCVCVSVHLNFFFFFVKLSYIKKTCYLDATVWMNEIKNNLMMMMMMMIVIVILFNGWKYTS